MKIYSIILFFLMLLLTGCDEKINEFTEKFTENMYPGDMKASIEGDDSRAFSTDEALATFIVPENLLVVSGTDDDGHTISFDMENLTVGERNNGQGAFFKTDKDNPANSRNFSSIVINYKIFEYTSEFIKATFSLQVLTQILKSLYK